MANLLGKVSCWFGHHLIKPDESPVNGLWWGFCRRCGARHVMGWDGKWRYM